MTVVFFSIHCEVIVTHLVTQLKSESLDEISSLLSTDRRSLLERCLPSIVVHILPLFAANKAIQSGIQISDGSSVKERLPHAIRCYDVLIRELGQQVCTFSFCTLYSDNDAHCIFPPYFQ